jgi:hypothetical protein
VVIIYNFERHDRTGEPLLATTILAALTDCTGCSAATFT